MYQNSIRRISPNSHPQFFIPRSEITFDERLPFIESVLSVLNESRFGPGSVYHSVLRSSNRPEPGAAPIYDFDDDDPNGLVPFYALPSLGRAGYLILEAAYRKAKQIELSDSGPNPRNSTSALAPNQGHGSP